MEELSYYAWLLVICAGLNGIYWLGFFSGKDTVNPSLELPPLFRKVLVAMFIILTVGSALVSVCVIMDRLLRI